MISGDGLTTDSKLLRDDRLAYFILLLSEGLCKRKTFSKEGKVTNEDERMALWGGIKNSKGKQVPRFVVVSPQEYLLSSIHYFDTWLKYWQVLASVEL